MSVSVIKPSKEQDEIIRSEKNTIVVSNPGTGKTTTLSLKVMKLLESGVKPENILCITFTDKAKKEMFDTIFEMAKGKFSESDIMKLNIHTFHSFAYNYLVDSGLVTGDIVGNNVMRYSILGSFENNRAFNYSKDYIISDIVPKTENAIRYIKSFGITPDKIDVEKSQALLDGLYDEEKTSYSLDEMKAFLKYFVDAYKNYEASKQDAIDYSDMLLIFIKKFHGKKFQHVLVDEMQDMNELEVEIVQKVGKNLFLVGVEKGRRLPIVSMIEYDDQSLMFEGKIDAIFQHDKGYLIVDYKTDKNSNYASEHKRQLSVYRKMHSILEGIPEDQISTCIVFVALRGGINTGKFDWAIEMEKRNAFPTFLKHLQVVLEWKKNPKKFIQDLLEKPCDDPLYQAIKEKLQSGN
jgi:ATP-dependent exoDNAse (exonuclease V) beta subunit